MLSLYVEAPFAAFRSFTAGSFRPTADFITPSAAYGLLLNIAGIEMRREDPKLPMTVLASGLPDVRIALGALVFPQQQSVYQQLHNYPVGAAAGAVYIDGAKGSKYNISPASRSFLSDIRAYICIDGNDELEIAVQEGLATPTGRRYGVVFLGDNNFLVDRIEIAQTRKAAHWYELVEQESETGVRPGTTRLTVMIDRTSTIQTRSALFAPTPEKTADIPEKAWCTVEYQSMESGGTKGIKVKAEGKKRRKP